MLSHVNIKMSNINGNGKKNMTFHNTSRMWNNWHWNELGCRFVLKYYDHLLNMMLKHKFRLFRKYIKCVRSLFISLSIVRFYDNWIWIYWVFCKTEEWQCHILMIYIGSKIDLKKMSRSCSNKWSNMYSLFPSMRERDAIIDIL